MNDLARILGLAGLATEQSVASPADRELKEYGEEGCPCCDGGSCMCKGDCPDCNCHGNNEWDESVMTEGASTIILNRDDFNSDIHPFFWEDMLDELIDDLPDSRHDYPDSVIIHVRKAEVNGVAESVNEVDMGQAKPDFLDVDGDGDTEESWEDAEEDKEEMKESEWCGVCGNDTCSCTDTMVESPTMDTTQLVIMMRNAGLSEEVISQKLDEWANTPEGVGEVEPTVHGDAYDFAQSVNLSLKRYLDAQDMKVQVTEHKVEDMKALYEAHKAKK